MIVEVNVGASRPRHEHIEWCKTRARKYLETGDLKNAVASMLSDLGEHPKTAHAGETMAFVGLLLAAQGDGPGVRNWVEGFQ